MSAAKEFLDFLDKQDASAKAFLVGRMNEVDPEIQSVLDQARQSSGSLPALEEKMGQLAKADQFMRSLFGAANIQSANITTSGDVAGDQTIVGNVVAGGNVTINFPEPPIPAEAIEKVKKIAAEYVDDKLPPVIRFTGITSLPFLGIGLIVGILILLVSDQPWPKQLFGWSVMSFGLGFIGISLICLWDRMDWKGCLRLLDIDGERAGYDKIIKKLKSNIIARLL